MLTKQKLRKAMGIKVDAPASPSRPKTDADSITVTSFNEVGSAHTDVPDIVTTASSGQELIASFRDDFEGDLEWRREELFDAGVPGAIEAIKAIVNTKPISLDELKAVVCFYYPNEYREFIRLLVDQQFHPCGNANPDLYPLYFGHDGLVHMMENRL